MYSKEINKKDKENYKANSCFNSLNWLSIYDDTVKLLGIFNDNDELIGSYYYQEKKRFKVLKSVAPPFLSPHCGFNIIQESTNPARKVSFLKKANQVIQKQLTGLNSDLVLIPFPTEIKDFQSFIWSGFTVFPKYTYQLSLEKKEEDLLAGMSSERRRNITKSIKENIIVKESTGCELSQQLIENTFVSQNLYYDKSVLQNVFSKFSTEKEAIAFTAYKEEKALATVFCIYDQKVAYYILGGYSSDSNNSGAGALAMWNAIKQAKKLGMSTFDFEGSMNPAIEKYFRGFGGELVPYFVLEKNTKKGDLMLKTRNLIKK